jgi:Family of unknown function (DUF6152)
LIEGWIGQLGKYVQRADFLARNPESFDQHRLAALIHEGTQVFASRLGGALIPIAVCNGGVAMRNRLMRTLGVTLGLLIVSVPLLAHHGAAQFDVGKKVIAKGTVTEWFWSNPHCFLRFDVAGADGQVVHWAVETQSGPNILPQGFSKQTFKVGDEVTVTLEPVKNGRPMGRLLQVLLPDGSTLPLRGTGQPPAQN